MTEFIQRNTRRSRRARIAAPLVLALAGMGGCMENLPPVTNVVEPGSDCSIPESLIFDGGPGKDGIPALSDPVMARSGEAGADYLRGDDRVMGLVVNGQAVAIPHSIGWWHEIVNLEVGGRKLAVTYCPLTGSSLAFDRGSVDGAEFGVSGVLYLTNLIMYDRRNPESLWVQMEGVARCGAALGQRLDMVPLVEMTWDGWRDLHPDTQVPAHRPALGQHFANLRYPYGNYEEVNNAQLLFPVPSMDPRRPPKERVLGLRGQGGIALPFGLLDSQGPVTVAEFQWSGQPLVVFWDRDSEAAVAHVARVEGDQLSFAVQEGRVIDELTGSVWSTDGRAIEGPLAGTALEPFGEALVAFWFAWASFYPHTAIWAPAVGSSSLAPSIGASTPGEAALRGVSEDWVATP